MLPSGINEKVFDLFANRLQAGLGLQIADPTRKFYIVCARSHLPHSRLDVDLRRALATIVAL